MDHETRWLVAGAACLMAGMVLGAVLFSGRATSDGRPPSQLIDLARDGMERADEARREEQESLLAMDRWHLIAVVLAAGIPLGIAWLVLRECSRRELEAEEVMEEVSRAMLDAEPGRKLPDQGRTAGLPETRRDGPRRRG